MSNTNNVKRFLVDISAGPYTVVDAVVVRDYAKTVNVRTSSLDIQLVKLTRPGAKLEFYVKDPEDGLFMFQGHEGDECSDANMERGITPSTKHRLALIWELTLSFDAVWVR